MRPEISLKIAKHAPQPVPFTFCEPQSRLAVEGELLDGGEVRGTWSVQNIPIPPPCPDCGSPRYWERVPISGINAVCQVCGRKGCFDNLKLAEVGLEDTATPDLLTACKAVLDWMDANAAVLPPHGEIEALLLTAVEKAENQSHV